MEVPLTKKTSDQVFDVDKCIICQKSGSRLVSEARGRTSIINNVVYDSVRQIPNFPQFTTNKCFESYILKWGGKAQTRDTSDENNENIENEDSRADNIPGFKRRRSSIGSREGPSQKNPPTKIKC